MEIDEVGPSNVKNTTDQFIDRSKVRILLCDNDSKSSQEVFSLLCKCSYQVTSVKSARQVVDALNAESSDIDIILSEVDLPTKKGFKLLKYIMRDKQLQRIPVIMMSTQDEVTLVVKCLRLGAADFLVKPLRTNELLNLWTHMWRRRRMLGLAEKNIVSYDFEIAASDPSDANTNSTTLFSDDTDDKSRRSVNPEMSIAMQQEEECNKVTPDAVPANLCDCRSAIPAPSDRWTGFVPFSKKSEPFLRKSDLFPKKSELKIGECSAFFTYVKSGAVESNCRTVVDVEANAAQPSRPDDKTDTWNGHVINGNMRCENVDVWENNSHGEDFPSSTSVPDSTSMERSCTPPVTMELMRNKSNDEGLSEVHMQPKNGMQFDTSTLAAHTAYPYFMSGVMSQFMMPSSAHTQQKDLQNHGQSTMMPHYNHLSHCPPHVPGMTPFSYYPMGVCFPQGQSPANHQVTSFGNLPSSETKLSKVDRREAALIKFRQKRKERCFDKKIRYVNRKKLAERRPRVRGQFVRKVNGVTVDLNGDPSPDLYEEDEEDPNSSPEDDTS
ncbi:two-component response regulator-like APRR1 [Chenopodium quinoa]|uniref:two-component response regulator-like APRR1 n=1 Tax=Chenopodium quinoa TaxID=63459 RepID=UPI000B78D939|nr:two-component response regulator-like APRR1 [Chenopodium quinoa]